MRSTGCKPIDGSAAYEDLDRHNGMDYFAAVPKKGNLLSMEYSDLQFLSGRLGIDDDCAQGLADELDRLGASGITEVRIIPCNYGRQAVLTDAAGDTYFVVLGGLGYLELIRRDSPDGEVLYAAVD